MTRVFATLMEHGTSGLPEEEFEALREKLRKILDEAKPGAAGDAGGVPPAPGGG
ncbi:MAG: hypothetical protein ABFS86_16695 [Planctomycetota bacterium]